MPNRHYPPPYLRYLKARLWNLGRPGFWGTAIFLSVVGLGIQEYWLNPDFLNQKQNSEVATKNFNDSSLSDEEQAIAADIDNLPVLQKDSEQGNLAVIANTSTSANKRSKNLFPDLISKTRSPASDPKSNSALGLLNGVAAPQDQNPFVSQADNLLQIGTNYGGNQLLGGKSSTASVEQSGTVVNPSVPGIGLSTQQDNSQNAPAISPLQAAINQSTNQNLSSFNKTPDSQTQIIGGASYRGATITPLTNNLPNPSLSSSTGFNPATSYNQPTVTNPPSNSITEFDNNQSLPNQVASPVTSAASNNISPYTPQTPTTSSAYSNTTLQQLNQIPQSNLSQPRPKANPYGGIEINGYKYP